MDLTWEQRAEKAMLTGIVLKLVGARPGYGKRGENKQEIGRSREEHL